MHAIPATSSIRNYYLDLVFLNATLQAAGHTALATEVQTQLNALKHERLEYERAEELEVVASAAIAGRDADLVQTLQSTADHVKAHHRDEFDRFFSRAPSRIARGSHHDELQATRTLVARLHELPAGDGVRTEFESRLARSADQLEEALSHKDDVVRAFALVRTALERTRASVNVFRLDVHAQLVQQTHDAKAADRFFRPLPARAPTTASAPATPGTAAATS